MIGFILSLPRARQACATISMPSPGLSPECRTAVNRRLWSRRDQIGSIMACRFGVMSIYNAWSKSALVLPPITSIISLPSRNGLAFLISQPGLGIRAMPSPSWKHSKNLPCILSVHTGHLPKAKPVEIWCQGEVWIVQKNDIFRQ